MKINQIELNNFRKYTSAQFNFNSQFNILIGNNASGKTTILDAMAMLLATYFQGSGIMTGGGILRKSDARYIVTEKEGQIFLEPQSEVWIKATASLYGTNNTIEWIRELGDRGGKAKEIIACGNESRKTIQEGKDTDLPILLYYGAGRLWALHRDVKNGKPGSQLDAYRYCLDPKSDQNSFHKWFKRLTISELQNKKNIPALHAVRAAVMQCIPGAVNFIFDINADTILIELKKEGVVRFNDLSDGFRNMVAMIADITHRCAKLNPHLGENVAKQTRGIIMIDELDLHLHPKWQRRVIPDLRTAFPEIQFITTTHSPFIIQSAYEGEIIDLDNIPLPNTVVITDSSAAAPGPSETHVGKSIEDIVETIMGIPIPQRSERYQDMYHAAQKYYTILKEGENATEDEKEKLKNDLDILAAPFSDNIAYHAFLDMERTFSGLGCNKKEEEE